MKTTYPIVLTSTEEGYTAYIPDFSLTAKGEKLSDAIDAAKNAIYMWAFSEENAEKPIPKPFSTNGIAAKSGQIVTLVDVSLENQQRMVQRNVAIPCWLNELAEKENIDLSQVLQEGLKSKLHITHPTN